MANRGSQFSGLPTGMNMMPQGQQQHFIQASNMAYPQMATYPGMMRYGPPGGQMMGMAQTGMVRLPLNQQQQFVAPPAYTPQMAHNFQANQQKQRKAAEDQRREYEKKRQFQLQQQKLKEVTKGGGKSLDANVLLDSMFGKSESSKPKPAPAPQLPQNDGFGDFLQAPATTPSAPSGAASSMGASLGAAHTDSQTTPSDAQPSSTQLDGPSKMDDNKGLEDMMMLCSDLNAPVKPRGFHKPSVREVQPQQHKTATFKESQKARQWISTNTDELATLFHLDAPLPSQRPAKLPPKPAVSQPGQHLQPHPGPPKVFTPPRWCVDPALIPELYRHALEASMRDGKIDTSLVYSILIRSGLPKEALGHIWSMANRASPGQLIPEELYMMLALIGLIQNRVPVPGLEVLHQFPQAPVPNLGQHVTPYSATGPHTPTSQVTTTTASSQVTIHSSPTPQVPLRSVNQPSTVVQSPEMVPSSDIFQMETQLEPGLEDVPPSSSVNDDDDDFDDFKAASPYTDSSSSYSSSVRTDSNAESSSDSSSCSSDLSKGMSRSRVMVFELSKNKDSSPYNFFSDKPRKEMQGKVVKDKFGNFDTASAVSGNAGEFADFQQAESIEAAKTVKQEQAAKFGSSVTANSFTEQNNDSSHVVSSHDGDWADFSSAPVVMTAVNSQQTVFPNNDIDNGTSLMSLEDDKYGALRDFEIAPETQPSSVFVNSLKPVENNGTLQDDDFGDFLTSPRSQSESMKGADLFTDTTQGKPTSENTDNSKSSNVKSQILSLFSATPDTAPSLQSANDNVHVDDDEFADFTSANEVLNQVQCSSEKMTAVSASSYAGANSNVVMSSEKGEDDFSAFTSTNVQSMGILATALSLQEHNDDEFADFTSFGTGCTLHSNAKLPENNFQGTETMPSSKPTFPGDDFADFPSPVKSRTPPQLASNSTTWDTEPPPLDLEDDVDDLAHPPLSRSRSSASPGVTNDKFHHLQASMNSSESDFSWKPQPPPLSSIGDDRDDFDLRPSPPPFPDDSPKTPTDLAFAADHLRTKRNFFGHQPPVKVEPGQKGKDFDLDGQSMKDSGSSSSEFLESCAPPGVSSLQGVISISDSQSACSLDMFPSWKLHTHPDSQSISSLDLPSVKNQSSAGSGGGDNHSTCSSDYGGLEMVKSASSSDVKSLESLDLKPSQVDNDDISTIPVVEESFGEFNSAPSIPPRTVNHSLPKNTATEKQSKPRSASELLEETNTPIVGDRYSKIMHDIEDSDRHLVKWQRCLESAYELLKNANSTFNEITSPSVCKEIIQSEKGTEYLSGIVEVYRVVCRIMASRKVIALSNTTLDSLLKNLDLAWNNLVAFIAGSHLMPDSSLFEYSNCGPTSSDASSLLTTCGVCLLDLDTSTKIADNRKIAYGGRQYHTSCGNFWINCVDSMLPALKVPELL